MAVSDPFRWSRLFAPCIPLPRRTMNGTIQHPCLDGFLVLLQAPGPGPRPVHVNFPGGSVNLGGENPQVVFPGGRVNLGRKLLREGEAPEGDVSATNGAITTSNAGAPADELVRHVKLDLRLCLASSPVPPPLSHALLHAELNNTSDDLC